MADNQLEEE